MINVKVIKMDLGEVLDAYSALRSPGIRKQIARNIMEGARAKLIKMAGEKLHSTRMDYIQGIQPLEDEGDAISLVIVGALPLMVEEGWDARQLHETLLHNPNANQASIKTTANGAKYRSIPFRHKTPGAGKQGGQPMGSQFAAIGAGSRQAPKTVLKDTASLGKAIHKEAKKLKGKQRLPEGLAPKLRKKHSTDIFAGMKVNMQPVQKKGGAPGQVSHQRTYTTFRTISDNVKDKWHHPGIEARDFMSDVASYVERTAPAAISTFMSQALGASR
jgi:hypothetical protein